MAGHSHWAGIKHKKGVADAKRAKIFSKHARAIITAARMGGGDPEMNLRLKYAIDRAKADNMPKDNIARAVKKGAGAGGGDNFESVMYEGYLAGGVAVMMDALTDNRNRTAPELRRILERYGGNLGVGGSVSFMFEHRAVFRVSKDVSDEESLLEVGMEVGAEDVRDAGDQLEVLAEPGSFAEVRSGLLDHKVECASAELLYLPKTTVEIVDVEVGQRVLAGLDALEDNEDLQNTYPNFEFTDEVMKQLG